MSNLAEQISEYKPIEFLVGDMVVIQNHIIGPFGSDSIFCIIEIKSDFLGDHVSMTDTDGKVWTSGVRYIRPATLAELKAKRRLTTEELARAEVS